MSVKPMGTFLPTNYLSGCLSITDTGELKIHNYGCGFVRVFFDSCI